MTPNGHNSKGESRLDRIERILEMVTHDIVQGQASQSRIDEGFLKLEEAQRRTEETITSVVQEFAQEHQLLLKAQVLLTDRVDELREAQKHTDERLNALIGVVDGVVRRRPQP